MADAVQKLFPETKVTIGPPIETGFYYDFDRKKPFTEDDLAPIEAEMQKIIDANAAVRAARDRRATRRARCSRRWARPTRSS